MKAKEKVISLGFRMQDPYLFVLEMFLTFRFLIPLGNHPQP